MAEMNAVPEPPGWPVLGHAFGLIDNEFPIGSFASLAEKYGEIYRLRLLGTPITFCSNHSLIQELCDEKRFRKVPSGVMYELRSAANDGLITAYLEEENWGIAHRVLMPALGPTAVRGMFPEMHDIASQLAMKWARMGREEPFTPAEDFTRLAMDTLALCSMGYRFNSFYNPETHPFLQAMARTLLTSRYRARRGTSKLLELYYRREYQQYYEDIAYLRKVSDDIIAVRAKNPSGRKDLVAAMLNGVDPKTGKHMTERSITDNALSFLVAGHETTAGLLSFTLYYLIKNPDVYRKAQQEIGEVIGEGPMNVDHLSKLPYLTAILREVLRLEPPLPVFAVRPYEDTLLANQYLVHKGESCVVLIQKLQRDPEVYGEDAEEFKPERMLDEKFNQLPPGSWKPFGNGQRACIGRSFATQEAMLMLAMLLQNFNMVLDDPEYELKYRQTLTMKPKDFKIRAYLRDGLTPTSLQHRLAGAVAVSSVNDTAEHSATNSIASNSKPLTILYGSNSGTCESLAQRLAAHAPYQGFKAVTMENLDTATGRLPKDHPVAIIATSYEGQPTDDAKLFVSWLENATPGDMLNGVKYSLYGLGHHDWVSTFHRIPKLIDAKLEKAGAKRLVPLALEDAGSSEVFSGFEAWEDECFWPTLRKEYGTESDVQSAPDGAGIIVDLLSPRSTTLRHHVSVAVVIDSQVLTAPGEPQKRHIEIQLPSNMSYRAGDYLAVLPMNPRETVSRVMRRFQIPWDAHIKITADQRTPLPIGNSVVLADVLGAYVELNQPATKKNISTLIEVTEDLKVKEELRKLSSELYAIEIVAKYTPVIDLLEKFPAIDLPLASFLAMLPPMRVRRYSLSSSPLWKPGNVTLTFSVFNVPSASREGRHIGVASSYLASLQPGDKLHVAVRPSHAAFHLPNDMISTPVIMVGSGSGIAPFRGFIQERAAQIGTGHNIPPAILFHGCREPGRDDIYSSELAAWESIGAVKVYRAYSRTPDKANRHKYVQDTLWTERATVNELWQAGARLYVCGSRELGDAVSQTMIKIHLDNNNNNNNNNKKATKTETKMKEDAKEWWESLRNKRYSVDVFN